MPTYSAIAKDGKILIVGDDETRAAKWLTKHDAKWLTVDVDLADQEKDPKTAAQRGYYFGLLLPEIHRELVKLGWTEKIVFRSGKHTMEREIPIRKMTAHDFITDACGRIGKDGTPMRLSDCDLIHAMRFIDHVLEFAEVDLRMNRKKLEALRVPEL
jgi:hypothetical protein